MATPSSSQEKNINMSKFFFNKLFIIQSLSDTDRKTGEELEARMNKWAAKNNISVQAVLFNADTMEEWEAIWNGIYTSIKDCANIPIIHLVLHGNETHIGIKQGKEGLIPLPELFEKIRKANELSRNNIFLSMAVCKGLNVIRSLSISHHMPFCGILASEEKLYNGEALDNYTIFYQEFFKTLSLDSAEKALRTNGVNQELYKLSKPEEIFMNAMAGYLETQSKDDKIEARAKSLAFMGGIDISSEDDYRAFVNTVRQLVKEDDEKYYPRFMNTFFMFDLYPEIAERFDVPKSLKEFKEWAAQSGVELD